MAKEKYTNDELTALIAETQSELKDLLKSEGKVVPAPEANGGQMAKDEVSGDEPSGEASSSGSDESSGPPAPASDKASEPSPEPSAAPAAAPAEPSAPAADPAASPASGPVSLPMLVEAYSQIPPADLQMHMQALQQVLAASGGAPAGAPAPVSAPPPAVPPAPVAPPAPADPAAPPPPAPIAAEGSKPIDPAAAMALKAEKEYAEKLAKSEQVLAEKSAKLESLEKSLEKLAETMLAPKRKGVTGIDLAKAQAVEPESFDFTQLSKSELTKKLRAIARNPSLNKAERNLISSFYANEIKVEDLAPLFEKKQ